jgi:hypothetical protein
VSDAATSAPPLSDVSSHHAKLDQLVEEVAERFKATPVVDAAVTQMSERIERLRVFASRVHDELDAMAQHVVAHGGP